MPGQAGAGRARVDADIAVGQVRFCLNGESGYRMIHIVPGHLSSLSLSRAPSRPSPRALPRV